MQLPSILLAGRYATLTSFFSLAYLGVFLPASVIAYSLVPRKFKKYFLLLASYGFFWLISGVLIIYPILTAVSLYGFGAWLERIQGQRDERLKLAEKEEKKEIKKKYLTRQRRVLLLAVVIHVGVLLTLKYTPFFATNVNALFKLINVPLQLKIPKYLIPIGISFFTMQAVSYIMDVYHGITKADRNIFRLALFISFFPQTVEGPICRYNQTAEQLWSVDKIQYENLMLGIQRILFGLMKKIVAADRLNPLVKKVFDGYGEYEGGIIALAAVCYTIQLYMDFSGSMDAVIGTAQIFGIKLPENFQRPFFSKTISEFWQRWHITLGTWFKEYIFYPVVTAKKMKNLTSSARKKIGNHFGPLISGSIALFCVWLCNGLWHGSEWNFIFFGMYHFVLLLCGNIISPAVKWTNKKLSLNPEWFGYRAAQIVRTTILVIIGELFFRAKGLPAGLAMFGKMVSQFSFTSLNDQLLLKLGVDRMDLLIVGVTVLIVFVVSILNEKGISVRESLAKKNTAIRWAVLYALILYIVIFGAYGPGYTAVDPLYASF